MTTAAAVRLTPGGAEPDTQQVCGTCCRSFAKYTCPRCFARTCSLACYKEHSRRCTESFAQENAEAALRGERVDERQSMLDILQRTHLADTEEEEEEEEEEEDVGLSAETLERLRGEEAPGLEALSEEERRRFLRAACSGRLSHLLQDWSPWWLSPAAAQLALRADGTALVQEVGAAEAEAGGPPPPPAAPLPPLASLLRAPPSPLLPYQLADAAAAYCLAQRAYAGDWHGDAAGAAALLCQLSSTLRAAAAGARGGAGLPSGARGALQGVLEAAAAGGGAAAGHLRHARADAAALLAAGRGALLRALEHARALLAEAGAGAALRRAERKLHFLCVFANSEPLGGLAEELRAEAEAEARRAAEAEAARARRPGAG